MRAPSDIKTKRLLGIGVLTAAAAVVAMGVLPRSVGAADPPGGKSVQRQVHIMERVIDEMLIDSPNWLISGGHDVRGHYIPGHGAIFTFEASLVGGDWSGDWGGWSGLRHLGRHMSFFWDDDEDDDRDRDRDRRDRDKDEDRDWRDRYLDREARRYDRGKDEVIEVLLDFGDVLDDLKDSETVTVIGYLEDADYFWDKDLSNLSVKAKVSDLKSYAEGKIKEDEMVKRMVIEEY